GNEVQRLTFPSGFSASAIQLTIPLVSGNVSTPATTTSTSIQFNANMVSLAQNIQAALDASAVLGAGRVRVLANSANEIDLYYGGTGPFALKGNLGNLTPSAGITVSPVVD